MKNSTQLTYRQVRANFDKDTVVVYQAYRDAIAKPALTLGRFVSPYSWKRMTWIKPSFLWMMARSKWATKTGQENILGIRITRSGFEQLLSQGCLTMFDPGVHANETDWRNGFETAKVHVQWDPERSIHGKKQQHRAIQVGIGSDVILQFTSEWIVSITDVTPLVRKIRTNYLAGKLREAKQLLPVEKEYCVPKSLAKQLGIGHA